MVSPARDFKRASLGAMTMKFACVFGGCLAEYVEHFWKVADSLRCTGGCTCTCKSRSDRYHVTCLSFPNFIFLFPNLPSSFYSHLICLYCLHPSISNFLLLRRHESLTFMPTFFTPSYVHILYTHILCTHVYTHF